MIELLYTKSGIAVVDILQNEVWSNGGGSTRTILTPEQKKIVAQKSLEQIVKQKLTKEEKVPVEDFLVKNRVSRFKEIGQTKTNILVRVFFEYAKSEVRVIPKMGGLRAVAANIIFTGDMPMRGNTNVIAF